MQIVLKADTLQKATFLAKGVPAEVQLTWLTDEAPVPEADAYFDLLFEENGPSFTAIKDKPVFINAVIKTGQDLPANCIRINAWNGFLERDTIEIATANLHNLKEADHVLQTLNRKYQQVPDIPGMIAVRIIAMIVNEAYFGLGDGISTRAGIDTAMKLGTNYPSGPFEWSEKIGLTKIYALLKKLSESDSRYAVAPALEKEIMQ